MKIPKTIHKNGHTYTFIQRCNKDMFLYECDLGYNETFKRIDLGLIDNTEIDKIMGYRNYYIVYDKETETEKSYNKITQLARDIDTEQGFVKDCINKHKWIKGRYFIERRVKE